MTRVGAAIREIELRVENNEKAVASANTSVARGYEIPEGIPENKGCSWAEFLVRQRKSPIL
jgi:hypothetical protein